MADHSEVTGSDGGTRSPDITAEALEALAPEWADLHGSVAEAAPFSHPAWFSTWLRHFSPSPSRPLADPDLVSSPPRPFADPDHAVFLAIRLEGRLVGVCSLDPDRDSARQLGDHNVCDYTGLLAAPGHEETVAAGVIEWLIEDLTGGLDLWGVPEASPLRPAFATAARRFGWSYAEEHEAVAPAAELPADFERYVAGLSKHDRHELRRKLRNLGAAGNVAFESVTSRAEIEARFDRFLEMMRISRDDKDEFLTPPMEAFFRDLATTFADLGLARLSTLRLDGNDVAMVFAFENESTTFLYNSGYDPAFAQLAVGLLSKAEAIREAIARGKRTFDFLRGEEEYKRRLGGEPRPVFSLKLRQG